MNNLVPFFNPFFNQGVGHTVGQDIELFPGHDLSTVFFRFPLDEGDFSPIHSGIPGQYFTNDHFSIPFFALFLAVSHS